MMELEIEATHEHGGLTDPGSPHAGGLAIRPEHGKLTPGQRYRVTVTPADVPRPEPAGFVLQYADGSFGETLKERPDQIPLMFGLPEGGGIVPLYEHPPAPTALEVGTRMHDLLEQEFKSETLAERMHREGWRVPVGALCAARTVDGEKQTCWVGIDTYEQMRELETPPAVRIARRLHSEGWRLNKYELLSRGSGYTTEVMKAVHPSDLVEAMREIEKEGEK